MYNSIKFENKNKFRQKPNSLWNVQILNIEFSVQSIQNIYIYTNSDKIQTCSKIVTDRVFRYCLKAHYIFHQADFFFSYTVHQIMFWLHVNRPSSKVGVCICWKVKSDSKLPKNKETNKQVTIKQGGLVYLKPESKKQ